MQLFSNNVNTYCLTFLANVQTIRSGGANSTCGSREDWRKDWIKMFVKWKGFLDLKDFPSEDYKIKENYKKIYANDQSFKDEEHEHRYELAKQWNG